MLTITTIVVKECCIYIYVVYMSITCSAIVSFLSQKEYVIGSTMVK